MGLGVCARDGEAKDNTRVLELLLAAVVLLLAAVVLLLLKLLGSTALSFIADSTGTSADDCANERFLRRLALCAMSALLSGAAEGLAALLLVDVDAR